MSWLILGLSRFELHIVEMTSCHDNLLHAGRWRPSLTDGRLSELMSTAVSIKLHYCIETS